MLGVAGLFVALYLYVSLIIQFIVGLAKPRIYNTSTFLIIPILGMTIGATFEGIFTITSWVGISLYLVCDSQPGNVERKYAEDASNHIHSQQPTGLQTQ